MPEWKKEERWKNERSLYKFVSFRPMYRSINAKWFSQAKHQQIILNWFGEEEEDEKKHGGNYFVFSSFRLYDFFVSLSLP